MKRNQNGSVHEYAYDNFGRLLSDTVTVLGNGVDGAARKIVTEYDVVGNVRSMTSSDAEENVLNQVLYSYDGNGQLQREYTAHEGAVDDVVTPFIGYEYDSIENGLRLTAQIYPSGKRICYEYDEYGRVENMLDGDDVLVEYAYSGSGSALWTKYGRHGSIGTS